MRSLIDMAAERGAFIDQSQSLNLFVSRADHRQTLLDVPARLETRAQDHVLPAVPSGDPDCGRYRPSRRSARGAYTRCAHHHRHHHHHRRRDADADADAVACSLENPEHLRGLRMMALIEDATPSPGAGLPGAGAPGERAACRAGQRS